ncbi:carboxynorspermidine decarboxylase [Pacificitalea manganoxidans]|uniref:Carboxynorspermidine/carboxyspermidine decarboxylase n=1 Tax=Pacificitalea manganoxidans TaxID=1411902 RepID=A0A291M2B0_9RHOB|nr:carboxynorspermidine decarboxylase [Pacificitalea manganoxidans]ATI43143.1 carboxynorspermidine decarboxylase [Pacificitalea manganoxidans]MDR6306916.1 carboxynorspermidine decarboxylase [Pacificitalea manganoxidans]
MSDTPDIIKESRAAFARLDLTRVPSPCFVVDEVAIERNMKILRDVADCSGAHVFLALKAFSMFALAPLIGRYLHGVCASGIHEARLGAEHFEGEVATFCAGYKEDDLREILLLSDHVIFNTPAQHRRFRPLVDAARAEGRQIEVGLRINPEHSEGWNAKYDPAAACSRLGTPISQLTDADMDGIDGLHMHTLCEQDFAPLKRTWEAVEDRLAPWLANMKWMNLGGGHHITRPDYDRDGLVDFVSTLSARHGVQVYLEPGEACALQAGVLIGEVLDLPENGMRLAISDISATCHMPDVIEAPYRPDLLGERDEGQAYRIGGPSCLAGDVVGDYIPAEPFRIGDRFAFLDQAHYSMVKTNTFNGVPLPALALWNSETDDLRVLREFGYDDFLTRLS